MDIMMGLSAIKQTLDITKDLREIDGKINVADFKLRLADLVERLLEAREALQDAKERERKLLEEIDRLNSVIALKARLEDERGCLYEMDSEGKRVGEPYCNHCYIKTDKLFRMVSDKFAGGFGYKCHNCEKVYFITRNNDDPIVVVRRSRDI